MPTLDKYRPEPCLTLSEEAWRNIEQALDLGESDFGLRCRIARYVEIFFLGPTAKSSVKAKDLRKHLNDLREDAATLLGYCTTPDDASDQEWLQHYALSVTLDSHDREVLRQQLSRLIGHVDDALHLVPKETRPRDDRYENLILALAPTYLNVTGEKPTVVYNASRCTSDPDNPNEKIYTPYSGKFLKFVAAVLDAIGDQNAKLHNNQALGQRTKRSLTKWRSIVGSNT